MGSCHRDGPENQKGNRGISLPSGMCVAPKHFTNTATKFYKFMESQDYYKVLEVDYDATDDKIRTNYLRLALKWHPDKHKGDNSATAKFQEINEAYSVLSDQVKRLDYDVMGNYDVRQYTLTEYLSRFKVMILTCNGLGIVNEPTWTHQLLEVNQHLD